MDKTYYIVINKQTGLIRCHTKSWTMPALYSTEAIARKQLGRWYKDYEVVPVKLTEIASDA